MVIVPPFISIVGVYDFDFAPALIPSSVAVILISPPFNWIYVPSIPSLELVVIVPSSIWMIVVACIASSEAVIFNVPPAI